MNTENEKAQSAKHLTLKQCKDDVARRYGAARWERIPVDFVFEVAGNKIDYDGLYSIASEMYACQFQSRISELEAELSGYKNLIRTDNSKVISALEANVKKYEEALRDTVSECKNEKSDLLNSIHKIEEIATEALKPE